MDGLYKRGSQLQLSKLRSSCQFRTENVRIMLTRSTKPVIRKDRDNMYTRYTYTICATKLTECT